MMDSVIQFEGTIYEDGYGLIAQKVMRDTTLPRQSKLIYAYMCSFASVGKNGERTAFPSVSLQCHELGMSEDTYYKWRKPLIDKGYIKIKKQRKEGAKFDNNIYSIVAVPVETDSEEKPKNKEEEPYPKNSGTEPYPKNPSTENPSTENSGTNIISSNSISFNNEEEEEDITLGHVMAFLNEQINKREITNQKTITAIYEVAAKCKAIGTTDRQAMENYCIKIVEDKMKMFGQKQGNKPKKQSIRKEPIPEWLKNQNNNVLDQEGVFDTSFEEQKRQLEERLQKYKKNNKGE